MNRIKIFPFMILTLLSTVSAATAEQVITGEIVSINQEVRSLTLRQTNPSPGQPETIYLTSVMDEDLVNVEAFDDLQVGQTVSVRATDLHYLTGSAQREAAQVTEVTKKEGTDLFDDVGEIDHSSVSIR